MCKHQAIDVAVLLGSLPQFSALSPAELATLAAGATHIFATRGQMLVRQGDLCQGMFIVLDGQVKLAFISSQGHEKVIQVVRPGQVFCEAMLFVDQPYAFFSQALCDLALIHLTKSCMLEVMAGNPGLMRHFLAGVASGYHRLLIEHKTIRLYSATERTVRYLFAELASSGRLCDGAVIDLDVAKGLIASQLNLTQEHFSRVLRELHQLGTIVLKGRRVVIPEMSALAACLSGQPLTGGVWTKLPAM